MAAESLRLRGYTVVPCLDLVMLLDVRRGFDDAIQAFPEFKPGAEAYVMGGFGALANPASFHNLVVRRLREWCMHASVEGLWRDYVDTPGRRGARLEQIIDRMMLRPKGTQPTSESWHRDVAILPAGHEGDETFGGWLNLDDTTQFFHCVPGTHTQPRDAGKKGFATIADKELKATYKAAYERVEIPPGRFPFPLLESKIMFLVILTFAQGTYWCSSSTLSTRCGPPRRRTTCTASSPAGA